MADNIVIIKFKKAEVEATENGVFDLDIENRVGLPLTIKGTSIANYGDTQFLVAVTYEVDGDQEQPSSE